MSFWGGFQHGFSGVQHNPVDYAREVDCPVLLMNGALNDRVTKQQVTSVFDQIQSNKRLVFFPETRHESCVRGDAELWKQTIGDFLNTF
jgi:dipeptidyl aminopeptidase/acylaminoacyl peptidase